MVGMETENPFPLQHQLRKYREKGVEMAFARADAELADQEEDVPNPNVVLDYAIGSHDNETGEAPPRPDVV